MQSLLQELQALEVELHHPGVRCARERLEILLHPEFHEVGRSGRQYSRESVITYLESQTTHPLVESTRFSISLLAPGCALLTYHSIHQREDGVLENPTWRSSIWLKGSSGWQLRYHQGTPASAE
jgi:hypothetical protein